MSEKVFKRLGFKIKSSFSYSNSAQPDIQKRFEDSVTSLGAIAEDSQVSSNVLQIEPNVQLHQLSIIDPENVIEKMYESSSSPESYLETLFLEINQIACRNSGLSVEDWKRLRNNNYLPQDIAVFLDHLSSKVNIYGSNVFGGEYVFLARKKRKINLDSCIPRSFLSLLSFFFDLVIKNMATADINDNTNILAQILNLFESCKESESIILPYNLFTESLKLEKCLLSSKYLLLTIESFSRRFDVLHRWRSFVLSWEINYCLGMDAGNTSDLSITIDFVYSKVFKNRDFTTGDQSNYNLILSSIHFLAGCFLKYPRIRSQILDLGIGDDLHSILTFIPADSEEKDIVSRNLFRFKIISLHFVRMLLLVHPPFAKVVHDWDCNCISQLILWVIRKSMDDAFHSTDDCYVGLCNLPFPYTHKELDGKPKLEIDILFGTLHNMVICMAPIPTKEIVLIIPKKQNVPEEKSKVVAVTRRLSTWVSSAIQKVVSSPENEQINQSQVSNQAQDEVILARPWWEKLLLAIATIFDMDPQFNENYFESEISSRLLKQQIISLIEQILQVDKIISTASSKSQFFPDNTSFSSKVTSFFAENNGFYTLFNSSIFYSEPYDNAIQIRIIELVSSSFQNDKYSPIYLRNLVDALSNTSLDIEVTISIMSCIIHILGKFSESGCRSLQALAFPSVLSDLFNRSKDPKYISVLFDLIELFVGSDEELALSVMNRDEFIDGIFESLEGAQTDQRMISFVLVCLSSLKSGLNLFYNSSDEDVRQSYTTIISESSIDKVIHKYNILSKRLCSVAKIFGDKLSNIKPKNSKTVRVLFSSFYAATYDLVMYPKMQIDLVTKTNLMASLIKYFEISSTETLSLNEFEKVISMIIRVSKRNPVVQGYLKETGFYQSLLEILSTHKPQLRTWWCLLLAVENSKVTSVQDFTELAFKSISNPFALESMYTGNLKDEAIEDILSSMEALVDNSDINCFYLSRSGICSTLFQWVIEYRAKNDNIILRRIYSLLEKMLSKNSSSDDVFSFINLLRIPDDQISNTVLISHENFLDALATIVSTAKRPDNVFCWDSTSGSECIILERQDKNAFTSGFTFICRFYCLQDFTETGDPASPQEKRYTIFQIISDTGYSFQAYLKASKLVIHIKNDGALVNERFAIPNVLVKPASWYHLVISHSSKRQLWGGSESELVIRLNSQQIYRKYHEYMRESNFVHFSIGAKMSQIVQLASSKSYSEALKSMFLDQVILENFAYEMNFSFYGIMSNIYLIDEGMGSNALDKLYQLDPRSEYFSDYEGPSILDRDVVISGDGLNINSIQRPSKSSIIKMDGLRKNGCCTVLSGQPKLKIISYKHDVSYISVRRFQDSISCVGGIQALLPLIPQIEKFRSSSNQLEKDCYEQLSQILVKVIKILVILLGQDRSLQIEFKSSNSIEILRLLLQQIHPDLLNMKLFQCLTSLIGLISSFEEFNVSFCENLLFDFSIWSRASINIQSEIVSFLNQWMNTWTSDERVRSLNLKFVLKTLTLYYWSPKGRLSISVAKSTIEKCIRSLWYKSISLILGQFDWIEDKELEDLKVILLKLTPIYKKEILALFVEFLLKVRAPAILERILSHFSTDFWIHLISTSDEDISILAFVALSYFNSQADFISARLRKAIQISQQDTFLISKLICDNNFNINLHVAALQIILNTKLVDLSFSWIDNCITWETKDLGMPFKPIIANMLFLETYSYKLMSNVSEICDSNLQVFERFLRESIVLVERNSENAILLSQSNRWVNGILVALSFLLDSGNSFISLLICRLFGRVVSGSFEKLSRSWFIMERVLIQAWSLESVRKPVITVLHLLKGCFDVLVEEIETGKHVNYSLTKLDNVYNLIMFMEDIMFSNEHFRRRVASYNSNMENLSVQENNSLTISDSLSIMKQSMSYFIKSQEIESLDIEISMSIGESFFSVIKALDLFRWTSYANPESLKDSYHLKDGGVCRIAFRLSLFLIEIGHERSVLLGAQALRFLIVKFLPNNTESGDSPPSPTVLSSTRMRPSYFDKDFNQKLFVIIAYLCKAFLDENNNSKDAIALVLLFVLNHFCGYFKSLESEEFIKNCLPTDIFTEEGNNIKTLASWLKESQNNPQLTRILSEYLHPALAWNARYELGILDSSLERFSQHLGTFAKTVESMTFESNEMEIKISQVLENMEENADKGFNAYVESLHLSRELERRTTTHEWISKMTILMNENGSWYPGKTADNLSKRRWYLDPIENSQRIRRTMKENIYYSNHKEASNRRNTAKSADDISNSDDSQNSIKGVKVPLKLQLLNQLNRAPVSRSTELSDMDHLNDLDEAVISEIDLTAKESPISPSLTTKASLVSGVVRFTAKVQLVVYMNYLPGRFEITSETLSFILDAKELSYQDFEIPLLREEYYKDRSWSLQEIVEIHYRRFMLKNCGLEIFFSDKKTVFFSFEDQAERNKAYNKIISARPKSLVRHNARNPSEILSSSGITAKWQKHEISNFEYLMYLNKIAGRTYNDLTQYPIMPWIIADYESPELDLLNPSCYRDLSRPIGALNPERLKGFIDRYDTFEDPMGKIPKFHYGTHYSSSAIVLFYLLRVEPFTSLHIQLQGGKFDHPDRQFFSLKSTWEGCLNGMSDVKELIPEFYYLNEMFENENDFDLGFKQNGQKLAGVELPPWAKSAEDFVRINREALESDYVSEHLHEWIDLIFGYKQKGDEAIKAHNVFFYLTYEGAVNLDEISDPIERKAVETQINNFGQTPCQLLKKPHPRRSPRIECVKRPIFSLKGTPGIKQKVLQIYECQDPMRYVQVKEISTSSLVGGVNNAERLITIDDGHVFGIHKLGFSIQADGSLGTIIDMDPEISTNRRLEIPIHREISWPHSSLLAVSLDGKNLYVGGLWNNSFGVVSLETGKTISYIKGHSDYVSCLRLSENGKIIVTGSNDGTVIAWEVSLSFSNVLQQESSVIKPFNNSIYYGHRSQITALEVNTDDDLLISASKMGTIIIHSLRDGSYERNLSLPNSKMSESSGEDIDFIGFGSYAGNILVKVTCREMDRKSSSSKLYLYSRNGKYLAQQSMDFYLHDVYFSKMNDWIVTITDNLKIVVHDGYNLLPMTIFSLSEQIYNLSFNKKELAAFGGTEKGHLFMLYSSPTDETKF